MISPHGDTASRATSLMGTSELIPASRLAHGKKESWPDMHGEYVSVRIGTESVEGSRLKCGGASN